MKKYYFVSENGNKREWLQVTNKSTGRFKSIYEETTPGDHPNESQSYNKLTIICIEDIETIPLSKNRHSEIIEIYN